MEEVDNPKLSIQDIMDLIMKPYPEFEIRRGKTALLIIDMQKVTSADFLTKEAVKAGLPENEAREALRDFDKRIKGAVANAQKLLNACREKGFDVVHVKIEAPTEDPRHTAKINRKIGFIMPAGSEASEIFNEVKPIEGELVFAKTGGGAFAGTNIDFVLRNMDIDSLIACGIATDACVLATVVHAAELGYDIILVEDACATFTREGHEAFVKSIIWTPYSLKVKKTGEVLKIMQKAQ